MPFLAEAPMGVILTWSILGFVIGLIIGVSLGYLIWFDDDQ